MTNTVGSKVGREGGVMDERMIMMREDGWHVCETYFLPTSIAKSPLIVPVEETEWKREEE